MTCEKCHLYFEQISTIEELKKTLKTLLKDYDNFDLEYIGHGRSGPTLKELRGGKTIDSVDNYFGCTSCGGSFWICFDPESDPPGFFQNVDDDDSPDIVHG